MPAEKLGQPPPIVQSILLVDAVHRDPTSGKTYILGTYNGIRTDRFPHSVPRLCVFVAVTNVHGPTMLRLRIIDMDEEIGPIHDSVHPVNVSDPNEVVQMALVNSVAFPAPGPYRIQVFSGSELLHELRLRLQKVEPSGPK